MLEHMDIYKGKLADVVDRPEFEYIETDPTGRYGRFKDVLGRGAMKTVYKAFDQVRGMEVAWNQVKLNDVFRSPDELQRLYSEVHLLSTLNHESIIKFFTSWIDVERRTFNFITEMLTSGTLREYRQKYKKVDIRAVKNWARQILGGLVYLHGHEPPVIHRDLKCDNIFVNGHLGQVKIGDLGFAAVLQGSQAHSVIGTPEFMAPELYDEDYNELVDIYSFGMCVLEMLTSEYPYNECSNPAQIYKKVTSGKLPENFYKIEDPEARKFVGKCLQTASKRLPAKELLLDPFLASEDEVLLSLSSPKSRSSEAKAIANDTGLLNLGKLVRSPSTSMSSPTKRRTDMTITGYMNAEDDTIYLKVQIAGKHGRVSNIYFPFDIMTDTPIDVATEMVKEIDDINDGDPLEIAEVIDKEISALVPNWKTNNEREVPRLPPLQNHPADLHHHQHQHHTYSYQDIDDDENDVGGNHHPFYSFSSSCSSSQASLSGLLPQSPNGTQFMRGDDLSYGLDWLQDVTLGTTDDETSSQTSQHSFKYSNMNYHSATELQQDSVQMMISPTTRQAQAQPQPQPQPQPHVHQHQIIKQAPRCTRFCPEEKPSVTGLQTVHKNKGKQIKGDAYPGANDPNPRLTRIRSLVDVRSQLLHKSLVEEVNKRRLSKTVTTVENIGFQAPFDSGNDVRSQLLHKSLVEEVNKRRLSKTVTTVENIGFQAPFDSGKGSSSSGVSGSGKSNPKYNVGKKDGFFKWRRSDT